MTALALAAIAFVGTHFLLSHPLRPALVRRLGELRFRGVYSLISFAMFGAMIWSYYSAGDQQPLWSAGEAMRIGGTVLMWIASILFVGSFVGNPALAGAPQRRAAPSGVLAITRHPMMWGFALWAIVHAAVIATPKALIFDCAILLLALGGSALQDRKKSSLIGETWHEWKAQTGFWPFARGMAWPGAFAVLGGTLFFLLASWLHPMPVGVLHWL